MVSTAMVSVFEEIANGDASGHIIFRGERVFAFLSLEGHPLIAPLTHLAQLEDLDDATGAEARSGAAAARGGHAGKSQHSCRHRLYCTRQGNKASSSTVEELFHTELGILPFYSTVRVNLGMRAADRVQELMELNSFQ